MPARGARSRHRSDARCVTTMSRSSAASIGYERSPMLWTTRPPEDAAALIMEANAAVQDQVVAHERDDEGTVYPRLANILMDRHGLSAMSRAHREILHLARLLARVVEDLPTEKIDRFLVRDA